MEIKVWFLLKDFYKNGGLILKIKSKTLIALLIFVNMICTVGYASDWRLINASTSSKVYIDNESLEKLSESEIGTWQKWVYVNPTVKETNGKPVSFVLSYMRFNTSNKMLCITEMSYYYNDGTHRSFPTTSCTYQKIVPDSIGYSSLKYAIEEIDKRNSKVSSNIIKENIKTEDVLGFNERDKLVGSCKNKVISKDYLGAIKDCNSLLEVNDTAIEARFWRSKANFHLSNYRDALIDLNYIIEKQPNDVQALNNRGIVYRDMGDYDSALSDITRALLIDKDYYEAYMNRARLRFLKFEYALSVDDLTKVLTYKPHFDTAYSERATALIELKQPLKAWEDTEQAIKLNPKNQRAYLIRATILSIDRKDNNAAIKEIDKAMDIDPKSVEAWYVAGRVFQQMRSAQQAVYAFTRALELSQNREYEAYLLRGLSHYDLGQKQKASDDWNEFLRVASSDNPRRGIAIELLKIAK